LFLPVQTSFEELLFRGYLMQGFGTLFKNAIYPLIITSLIFGMLHGFNPEVQKLGSIILIYYIATGLLFGIVTLMDDGTELALGMHAANNVIAAVLVTSDWMVFQTDALWVDVSEPSVGVETFFPVLVVYPIVIWVFSKKYNWNNWKSKLLADIKKPVSEEKDQF
jgi:Na+/H+-dicarboxylate symporter